MQIKNGTGALLTLIGKLKDIPSLQYSKAGITRLDILLGVEDIRFVAADMPESYINWFPVTLYANLADYVVSQTWSGAHLYVEAMVKMEKMGVDDDEGHSHFIYGPVFHGKTVALLEPERQPRTMDAY